MHQKSVSLSQQDNLTNTLVIFKGKEELTIQEVSDRWQVSRPTAVRKLNLLIEKGLIDRIGNTKSLRYKLCEEEFI